MGFERESKPIYSMEKPFAINAILFTILFGPRKQTSVSTDQRMHTYQQYHVTGSALWWSRKLILARANLCAVKTNLPSQQNMATTSRNHGARQCNGCSANKQLANLVKTCVQRNWSIHRSIMTVRQVVCVFRSWWQHGDVAGNSKTLNQTHMVSCWKGSVYVSAKIHRWLKFSTRSCRYYGNARKYIYIYIYFFLVIVLK